MKVLLVNKFNFLKGGADKYFLELADLLSRHGVKVAKFAVRHEDNLPDRWSKYWPDGINFDRFRFRDFFKYLSHIFWNREAARQFEKLIIDFKPDLVHLHNIYHHLSPSILPVAKRHGLPVVMHLHDYKLVCPNYKMFTRGRIDESCKGGRYWRCVARRCVKNSFLKSALAAAEMWLHHKLLKVYEKNIDLYIAPSQFMKNKVAEWGVPEEKIVVLPHFINAGKFQPHFPLGDYLLYFGRLEQEKGVAQLLMAMTEVRGEKKLKIVGSGPEHKNIKTLIKRLALDKRVELVGPKYGEALKKIISRAYAVVVPSQWYEVFGLVNLEAAALGKFVVAANIGGIPEAVKSSHGALLFQPRQRADLAAKLNWVVANPRLVEEGAREARSFVVKEFSPQRHLAGLLKIYHRYVAQN